MAECGNFYMDFYWMNLGKWAECGNFHMTPTCEYSDVT